MKTSFVVTTLAMCAACSVFQLAVFAPSCSAQPLMYDSFDECDDLNWKRVDGTAGQNWGPGIYEFVPEANGLSCAYRLASNGTIAAGASAFDGHLFSVWPESIDPIYNDGFVRLQTQVETMGTEVLVGMRNGGRGTPTFSVITRDSTLSSRITLRSPKTPCGWRVFHPRGLANNRPHWWLQAGTVGDQLTLKFWQDGDPEPLRPQISVTDNTAESGSFFIGAGRFSEDNLPARTSALFDNIQFTVGEPSVESRDLSIVVPGEYRSAEDPSIPTEEVFDLFAGARFQEVYPAGAVGDLPGTHRWITGLRYRPDSSVDSGPVTATNRKIFLSTVGLGVDDLSEDFATNRGPDETLVFDGPAEWAISEAAFSNGTRDFEVTFDFDTPFLYDPSMGNLLLEGVVSPIEPGGRVIPFDTHTSFGNSLWGALDANAESAVGRIPGTVTQFILSTRRPGDFNGNDQLDVADIDALTAATKEDDPSGFDLTNDGLVDQADRRQWVHDLKKTYFGDSNLDGEFNSHDLVTVFQAGQYDDGVDMNSGWSSGDWNGDGDFTSIDLVIAFQDGGYGQGPQAAVSAVPEPNSVLSIYVGLALAAALGQHRRQAAVRR